MNRSATSLPNTSSLATRGDRLTSCIHRNFWRLPPVSRGMLCLLFGILFFPFILPFLIIRFVFKLVFALLMVPFVLLVVAGALFMAFAAVMLAVLSPLIPLA